MSRRLGYGFTFGLLLAGFGRRHGQVSGLRTILFDVVRLREIVDTLLAMLDRRIGVVNVSEVRVLRPGLF